MINPFHMKMLERFTRFILFLGILPVIGWTVSDLHADEPAFIRGSTRARGMGNAFVAVIDDRSTLSYNPAGLATVNSTTIEVISAQFSQNDHAEELLASQDSLGLFANLIGKKIYIDGDLSVGSMVGPHWGYSVFTGGLVDIEIHNPTLPYFDVNAYFQTGIIAGESTRWSESIDLGYAVKYISRNGYVDTLYISEIANVDDLENKFKEKSVFGADLGLIYHLFRDSGYETRVGLVARNIGSMNFGRSGGYIPATYDSGLATTIDLGDDSLLVAVDRIDFTYKGTEYKSTKRNLKIGIEYSLGPKLDNGYSWFSGRIGRNGEYYTYGFSLNLWGVILEYANWSEEWGQYAGDKEDKRQSFQMSLLFSWGGTSESGNDSLTGSRAQTPGRQLSPVSPLNNRDPNQTPPR